MRTLLSVLGALVVCAALPSACARFGDDTSSPVEDAATLDAAPAGDASDASDAPSLIDGACWTRPFGVPVNVPELSSVALELSVRLSPDERTAFLATNRDGGAGGVDLYTSTRATRSEPFGPPSLLPLNTAADDTHPSLSFDGLSLYFVSAQPSPDGGGTSSDIYVAVRPTSTFPFGAPALVTALSGPFEDSFPYAAPTGGMYFASNRDGEMKIFFAAQAAGSFAPPAPVDDVHEPGTLSNLPVVSADGLWLYFASSRGGGGAQGELDIWVAQRESLTLPFGAPVNVAELNTPSSDRPSWISADGCRMYLTSTRAGGLGDLDVWRAER
jgi:Tol biopolymer transport system component